MSALVSYFQGDAPVRCAYKEDGAPKSENWVLPITNWNREVHGPFFLDLQKAKLLNNFLLVQKNEKFYVIFVFVKSKTRKEVEVFFQDRFQKRGIDLALKELEILDVHHLCDFEWEWAKSHVDKLMVTEMDIAEKVAYMKSAIPRLKYMKDKVLEIILENDYLVKPLIKMLFGEPYQCGPFVRAK